MQETSFTVFHLPQLFHATMNRQIPLECGLHNFSAYLSDTPIFIFFHVGGTHSGIMLWLVQFYVE